MKYIKPKKGYELYPYIEGMKIPTKKTLWKSDGGVGFLNADKSDVTLTGMPNLSSYISENSDYLLHLYIQYKYDGVQIQTINLNNAGPHWITYIRDLSGTRKDILFLTVEFSKLNTSNWVCKIGGNISVDRNRYVENNTIYTGYKLKRVVLEKL